MKKKWLTVVCSCLVGVMALGLVACGDNGGGGGGGGDATIDKNWWSTTGELEFDANNEVVFDNVEIKLSSVVNGVDKGSLETIIAQFNAQYRDRINITMTNIAEASFENSVSTAITNNNNAPDLIMSHQKSHKSLADNKLIQPLDEAMELSGIQIDMSDYASGLAQYASLGYKDNPLFSVPADAQSMVVFYNKDLMQKYNGDNDLPSTRAEIMALCDAAKNDGVTTPISWATDFSFFSSYVFETAIVQNGGAFYNSDTYYAEWSSEPNLTAYKNAIASIREYTTKGYAAVGTSEANALSAFLSNKALFFFYVPWYANDVISAYAKQNNVTVSEAQNDKIGAMSLSNWFALDPSKDYSVKVSGDSHFFAMSKTVSDINKKAAILEFVKWFTQTGSVGVSWAKAGHITASNIIANSTEYKTDAFVTSYTKNFYPDISDFECLGNTPYYATLRTSLGSIITFALQKTDASSDETFIKTNEKKLNDEIDFVNM